MSSSSHVLKAREGYEILRYAGASTATRVYKGKQTGTSYRFGNNPAHQVKYVYGQDVSPLLELSDGGHALFQVLKPEAPGAERPGEPQMVAAGAPMQTAQYAGPMEMPESPQINGQGESAPVTMVEYSTRELRLYAGEWEMDKVRLYLEHEEAKDQPRPTAVAILTGRLNTRA